METSISNWAEGSAFNTILDMALGYRKSQLLFTAVKYDIFTLIDEGITTPAAIAEHIKVNLNALERLLNALVAIKLLNRNGLYYENSVLSAKHLVKTSKEYYGFVQFDADLMANWSTLPDVLKTGKCVANTPLHLKNSEFIRNYIMALDWRSKMEMNVVLPQLSLLKAKKFLKIGGLSFRYPLEIARQNPNIEVSIADDPTILRIVEDIMLTEFDCRNIKFVPCNYKVDDYGQNYDTIFMDSMIEGNSVLTNIASLKRVYASISKGGKLLIHQHIIDDRRTSPLFAALESVNLLLNTDSGDCYTHSDIWVVLKEAGFEEIDTHPTEAHTSIIIASKSRL